MTELLLSTLPSKSFSPKCWEWLSNAVYFFTRLFLQNDSRFCQVLPPPFSFPKHSFTSAFLFHHPAAFILFFFLSDIWSPFLFFHHGWASLSTTTTTLLLDSALFHLSCLYLWPLFSTAASPRCPLPPHQKCTIFPFCPTYYMLEFCFWRRG